MNLCLLLIQLLKAGAGDSVHSRGNLVKDTRCDTESSENIILSCSDGTFSWSNYQWSWIVYVLPYINVERQILLPYQFCKWTKRWKRQIMCPAPNLQRQDLCSTHTAIAFKNKINQSSFWHWLTGLVMDSVYDMSFSRVGSLGHSCSASGLRPEMKHISGLLSHLPQYFLILRVSSRKMLKKKKRKRKSYGWESEKTTLEKSQSFLKLKKYV